MTATAFLTGVILDIVKKHLIEAGKKVVHDLKDSLTGKKIGKLICYRKHGNYNNVILFVHGYSGRSDETFGFTPDLLEKSDQFNGWDIFSIGYSSDLLPAIGKGIWAANPDITKISSYLKTHLENIFHDYDRVALVAHSMGGLAVQRLLIDIDASNRDRISHVLLFGTPSLGLKKAYWLSFWNTQIRDINFKSEFILSLRRDWNLAFESGFNFVFKTIAGLKDEFVPVESSLGPFEQIYHGVIEGNHISMVKPLNTEDYLHQSFQIILNTLTEKKVEYLQGNPEDINILLGEYHKVINKFLPNAKDLAKPQLTQLVFALECSDKGEEAMKILDSNPQSKNDSDLLGILGGRHKRKFLVEGLQKDLEFAFGYYHRGLKISEEQKDPTQIYYHAINLAFLYQVGENKNPEMEKYAQIALGNCISKIKNHWELATIAEANLYLGNLKIALSHYKKAAKLAGNDVRAKVSIHSNAYYGYQSFMGLKDKNSDFILQLGRLFLS